MLVEEKFFRCFFSVSFFNLEFESSEFIDHLLDIEFFFLFLAESVFHFCLKDLVKILKLESEKSFFFSFEDSIGSSCDWDLLIEEPLILLDFSLSEKLVILSFYELRLFMLDNLLLIRMQKLVLF